MFKVKTRHALMERGYPQKINSNNNIWRLGMSDIKAIKEEQMTEYKSKEWLF